MLQDTLMLAVIMLAMLYLERGCFHRLCVGRQQKLRQSGLV